MSVAVDLVREALRDPGLRAEIVKLVRDSIPASDPAEEPLLDAHAAAKILGRTAPAIRMAAYRNTVPCVRVGRQLRFRRSELLALAR